MREQEKKFIKYLDNNFINNSYNSNDYNVNNYNTNNYNNNDDDEIKTDNKIKLLIL